MKHHAVSKQYQQRWTQGTTGQQGKDHSAAELTYTSSPCRCHLHACSLGTLQCCRAPGQEPYSNNAPSLLPELRQHHGNATTIVALTVQPHQQAAELGPGRAEHQCGLAVSRAVVPWHLLCGRPEWRACWWLFDPGRLAAAAQMADYCYQHESCREAHCCKQKASLVSWDMAKLPVHIEATNFEQKGVDAQSSVKV